MTSRRGWAVGLGLVAMMCAGCSAGGGDGDDNPPPVVYQYYAYVANYGASNVSAYTINATTGALTAVAGSPFAAGALPIGVAVDPSGKFTYVANYQSGNVSAYTINATTGALTAVAGSPFAAGVGPYGVAVVRREQ